MNVKYRELNNEVTLFTCKRGDVIEFDGETYIVIEFLNTKEAEQSYGFDVEIFNINENCRAFVARQEKVTLKEYELLIKN